MATQRDTRSKRLHADESIVVPEVAKRLLISWILVPFSIVVMLYFVLALNTLIGLGTVAFPASVACLLILFFVLIFLDLILSKKHMNWVLKVLDVPTGFALRTMNLYFTPSFVTLPLASSISGKEVGVLIAVFVIGYLAQFMLTAYTSVAVQILLGRWHKHRSTRRVDAPRDHGLSIVPTDIEENRRSGEDLPSSTATSSSSHELQLVGRVDEIDQKSVRSTPPTTVNIPPTNTIIQSSNAIQHHRNWADSLVKHLDVSIYFCLFTFIGIPVYYSTAYTMPIFLTLNILLYHLANAIPQKVKRIAHPVLVTSLLTILTIWILSLTRHKTLHEGLTLYKTSTTYLSYFRSSPNLPLPGAGDILSSLLDASIVSLAMPMYQYRHDLYHHFIAIFIPVSALAVVSLFAYPPLCYKLGVEKTISLAMAPRSVTLALAQLSAENLGGSVGAISPIAVVSGICGPIFGPSILKLLRIPKDDFVTTGVVLGANSSAIATAMLLQRDRRAAALSALAMSVFGILFVILTVIPPVVGYVQSLVGM
ncbi:uncharacterized protein PAC_18705 [Phialocephala subalpina]|uniref:LrgB-like protein n=1 Tax=Phialocephala subalpina TaxID=576137 RepID=A0A1L7XUW7_9HELO|nr:uncharacterized protein PAC_18705 [Phialocephala subalpina]